MRYRRARAWAVHTMLGALVALPCAAQPGEAQSRPVVDSARAVEAEAATLLQGRGRQPFLDSARIRLVARALNGVRAGVPVLRDVRVPGGLTGLTLYPPDDSPALYGRNSATVRRLGVDSALQPGFWRDEVARLGVPEIDSVNARLPIRRIHVRPVGRRLVATLEFSRPPNYAVLGRAYDGLAAVRYALPDFMPVIDGTRVDMIDGGRRLHFRFGLGSGDCALSCINWTYYRATYDTLTHAVTHERLPAGAGPRMVEVDIWGWDSIVWIDQYPTFDALRRGLAHEEAWRRGHAVRLLARVLGPIVPVESSTIDPMRNTLLTRSVQLRRRDAYLLLVARLADEDATVAATALHGLRALTGRNLPGGAAAAEAWRRWIEEHVAPF